MRAPTYVQEHRHLCSLFLLLACLGKTFGFHCISHTVVFFIVVVGIRQISKVYKLMRAAPVLGF